MKLTPYVRRYFNAPKEGSGGSASVPPPPSSSTPPPPPAPPKGTPPPGKPNDPPPTGTPPVETPPTPSELDDFTPPSLDILGNDDALPDPNEPPAPKPDDKKKTEDPPKPDDQKSALDDPKAPANLLREELKKTRDERDALKKQVEDHPKVKELSDALKAKDDEYKLLETQLREAREQVNMLDPLANEDLQKLHRDFDADYNAALDSVPQIEPHYKSLLKEFQALPRDDRAKYAEAFAAFEEKLEGIVGPRRITAAMDLIRKGADFISKEGKLREELKAGAGKAIFEKRQSQYDRSFKLTEEHLKGALEIEPDILEAHPYHPLGFIKNGREGLDDKGKQAEADFEGRVTRYIKFAANGVSPKGMAELDALPPKQRQERLQQMEVDRLEAAKWVRQMAVRGAMYERWMSGILADYAKLREAAGKKKEALPPDPTKKAGEGGADDKTLKLEEYQAPVGELAKI